MYHAFVCCLFLNLRYTSSKYKSVKYVIDSSALSAEISTFRKIRLELTN
jgi:hypothetical protein